VATTEYVASVIGAVGGIGTVGLMLRPFTRTLCQNWTERCRRKSYLLEEEARRKTRVAEIEATARPTSPGSRRPARCSSTWPSWSPTRPSASKVGSNGSARPRPTSFSHRPRPNPHVPQLFRSGPQRRVDPNSGSFKRRLAAFRDWKFIPRMTGDRVVFTDLGRRVAYPTDSAKERNDLQEAFQNATLFWKVYDDSAKGVGISLATLANHGVQLGVAPMSKEQFAESLAQSAVEAGLAELEGNKVVFLGGNDVAVELRDSAQVTDQMVVAHPIYGGGPIGTVRVDAADPEEPVSAVDPGVVASARQAASVQGVGRDVIEHQREPEERPAVLHQQTWDFKVGNLVFEIKSSRSLPASAFMQIGKVMSEIEKLKDLLTEGPESGESAE
jgi:hypothetical protein